MPGSPESSALCRRVGEIEGFGGLAELVEIGRAAGIVTFGALAASEPVADKDLTLLNRALAEAPKRERLAQAMRVMRGTPERLSGRRRVYWRR